MQTNVNERRTSSLGQQYCGDTAKTYAFLKSLAEVYLANKTTSTIWIHDLCRCTAECPDRAVFDLVHQLVRCKVDSKEMRRSASRLQQYCQSMECYYRDQSLKAQQMHAYKSLGEYVSPSDDS